MTLLARMEMHSSHMREHDILLVRSPDRESNEIKVVNGKLNIDLTRLWLLHYEIQRTE
jgi:hypothetical protein